MKRSPYPTGYTIQTEGFKALVDRLGAGGALRFIRQYETGKGNYTEERKQLFKNLKADNLKKTLSALRG